MMNFINLRMENWLSYKGRQEISFAVGTANITVLFGENMTGKTNLLNAVRWALYGLAIDRQKREIPLQELINITSFQDGANTAGVELEFKYEDKKYCINRYIVFQPNPIIEKSLSIDGVFVKERDVDSSIDEILPRQILEFLLFDGELLTEFESLVVSTGQQQAKTMKNAIESKLGLPMIQKVKQITSELAKSYKADLNQELEKSNANKFLLQKSKEIDNDLALKKASLDEAMLILAGQESEVSELRTTLDGSKEALRLQAERSTLKESVRRAESAILEKQEKMKQIASDHWKSVLNEALAEKFQQIESQVTQLDQAKADGNAKALTVLNIQDALAKRICNECGQQLSEQIISEMQAKLAVARQKIEVSRDIDDQVLQLRMQLKGLEPLRVAANDSELYRSLQSDVEQLISTKLSDETQIAQVSDRLRGVDTENNQILSTKYENLVSEKARTEALIENLETEVSELEAQGRETQNSLIASQGGLTNSTEKFAAEAERVETIVSKLSDIYRDRMRQAVGRRAQKTFAELSTEVKFDSLEINETYGLELMINGVKVNRSAGAEQIVAMSLIEALNHFGRAKGPMIMDTPFGRLDKTHRQNVLRHFPSVVSQFVIFAHSGEVSQDDPAIDSTKVGEAYRLNRIDSFETRIERAA